VFLKDLNSPFGMALIGHDLYVANTDAVLRFPYVDGETQIDAPGVKVADLPAGPINHHWTKNIIASRDGSHLYATVGSNSNAAENGLDKEDRRAAILEIDPATGQSRLFASGLRNPNGMAWQPATGVLWTVVNERDELGSDLVPDYLTSVKDGGFYGWPFSYYGQHVDTRVEPQRPDLVAKAIVPDYALGSHTASLGLTFSQGTSLPERYRNGAFVGQHGSWNRKPRSGYKVIFVPFANGRPAGQPLDVVAGFINADDQALGAWGPRPQRRQWGIEYAARPELLSFRRILPCAYRSAPLCLRARTIVPGMQATRASRRGRGGVSARHLAVADAVRSSETSRLSGLIIRAMRQRQDTAGSN
jgi:glucose/arabinose dehydrogenase